MLPYYPLGVYKDVCADGFANAAEAAAARAADCPIANPAPTGRGCAMSRSLNIVLAGFGGQGVLFAGKLIAYAGLLEDREASWLPSDGPEMRGGTANCSVCLSDDPIGKPARAGARCARRHEPALARQVRRRHGRGRRRGGRLPRSSRTSRTFRGVRMCALPATAMAEEGSASRSSANIIMAGKLFAETRCLAPRTRSGRPWRSACRPARPPCWR